MKNLQEKQIKDLNISLNEDCGEYIVITDGLMVYDEQVFKDYKKAVKAYEKACKVKHQHTKQKHDRTSKSGF